MNKLKDKFNDQYKCPSCGSNDVKWFEPTWKKNGYHQCKDCNYRLSITEVSNQRHYLRNIKPYENILCGHCEEIFKKRIDQYLYFVGTPKGAEEFSKLDREGKTDISELAGTTRVFKYCFKEFMGEG